MYQYLSTGIGLFLWYRLVVSVSVKYSRYLEILFKHKICIKIFCFVFSEYKYKKFLFPLELDWICIIINDLQFINNDRGRVSSKQDPNIVQHSILCLYQYTY